MLQSSLQLGPQCELEDWYYWLGSWAPLWKIKIRNRVKWRKGLLHPEPAAQWLFLGGQPNMCSHQLPRTSCPASSAPRVLKGLGSTPFCPGPTPGQRLTGKSPKPWMQGEVLSVFLPAGRTPIGQWSPGLAHQGLGLRWYKFVFFNRLRVSLYSHICTQAPSCNTLPWETWALAGQTYRAPATHFPFQSVLIWAAGSYCSLLQKTNGQQMARSCYQLRP